MNSMGKEDFKAKGLSETDSSPRNELESGSAGIGTHTREKYLRATCHRKKRLQIFWIWNETDSLHTARTRAEFFHGFGVKGNNKIDMISCERSSL